LLFFLNFYQQIGVHIVSIMDMRPPPLKSRNINDAGNLFLNTLFASFQEIKQSTHQKKRIKQFGFIKIKAIFVVLY